MRQEIFSASKGKGARLNEHRIRVSKCSKLEESLLGTGFPSVRSEEQAQIYARELQTLLPLCSDIRRAGAASLDLAYVAAGRLDGYWDPVYKSGTLLQVPC